VCNKVNEDNDFRNVLAPVAEEFDCVKILDNDIQIEKAIEAVYEEVEKRKKDFDSNSCRIILAFVDIYNVRSLRKSGYADSPLSKKLVAILKDGTSFGIHCIVHASSFENLRNVWDIHSMLNEFNVKIELRGGDGYKIFQSNDIGIEKSTPNNLNIANMQTPQMDGIKKIKVYSLPQSTKEV